MADGRPPDHYAARTGIRPHTDFGRDDADLAVEVRTLRTEDHHHWDALWIRPRAEAPGRDDTLVVVVHGSMGNALRGVPRRAAFVLAQHGFAALSVNTRMANFGVVYGSGMLDEVPIDLDAAIAEARTLGYARVVLLGHSLGAVAVIDHLARRRPTEVVGLCALAPPADLRESLRERWERFGAEPGLEEVEASARAAVAEGRDDIVIVRRGSGPGDAPQDAEVWSLACWWRSRGPEAACASAVDRIGSVAVPVMLVSAGEDPVVPAHSAETLATAARAAGVDVRAVEVEDADHSFWGVVPDALAPVATWIDDLPRPAGTGRAPVVARTEDRLVTVTASDGVEHDALLHRNGVAAERRTAATGRRTALVHLHGNQGSFTVGSLRFAHAPLASLGFPLLALETRVGNVSQIFGEALFEETAEDVEGAVALLAREGFDGVVVSGYSLGAVMAIRAAAGKLPLPVRGLLTFGASADLPESTRRLMDANDARPGYEEMVALTRPAAGRPQDDFPVVVRRAYLPSDAPRGAGVYTARTWWHSRGPAAIDSRSHRWIGRVDAPILLVQGTEDAIVAPEDADRLADIARAAGREAEIARIEGAGHSFHGYERRVIEAAAEWLERIA